VESGDVEPKAQAKSWAWKRVLAYGVLPGVALLLALAAGCLKWQDCSVRHSDVARIESVQAANHSTLALLSYRPDSVDKDLAAARDRLIGNFCDSYTSLTNDVVIPGATQKHISPVATVSAAAVVSADESPSVLLVFVDQTITVGTTRRQAPPRLGWHPLRPPKAHGLQPNARTLKTHRRPPDLQMWL
jgi:Mce-associated membrane protein